MTGGHGDWEPVIEKKCGDGTPSPTARARLRSLVPTHDRRLQTSRHWNTRSNTLLAGDVNGGSCVTDENVGHDVGDAFDADGMEALADDVRSVQARLLRCFLLPQSRKSPTNRWLSKRDLW
jgi:hypothetical protein